MKKQNIRVKVTTVSHPNPTAGIDLIARLIVNELLKNEQNQQLIKTN